MRRRKLTAEDWKAVHFAWTLLVQVCEHGKPALDTFLAAVKEMRSHE